MRHLLFLLILLFYTTAYVYAQDPRERNYYYEILQPSHANKPQIEGFAKDTVRENLNRGLYATMAQDGKSVYLCWRLLKSDSPEVSFNIYRSVNGKVKRLNSKTIKKTCDFIDTAPVESNATYWVVPVESKKEKNISEKVNFNVSNSNNYSIINLKNNETKAGKIAVADLNGDGAYDYIIRTPDMGVDPGSKIGNMDGSTYKIEAYLNDGTFLWSKDLGQGIEPGVWYSPFVAYDFNGDGKAEVALKTSPATTKRNEKGHVDSGEEYLTILDGLTGKTIAQVNWPERNFRLGDLNRQNRNQIGMAYLDGKTPCVLACRGTYKQMVVDAWQLKGNELQNLWHWDGDEENPVVRSQGSHNMVCGDVDNDGRDEILLGSCMLDDNGTLLWSAGLGHPDKIYLTDINPERNGMEVFLCLEPQHSEGRGICVVDAKTGEEVWNIGQETHHVGDGMVTDFDTSHPGLECFASEDKKGGSTDKYLMSSDGVLIGKNENVPPCRNWIWWDGDLLRETFKGDDNKWGASSSSNGNKQQIIKWKGETITTDIEGDILLIGDIIGDWREEVITSTKGQIRIYHTNIPAKDRRITLMQDHIYRSYILERSQGYPQSPVPSYYLGE